MPFSPKKSKNNNESNLFWEAPYQAFTPIGFQQVKISSKEIESPRVNVTSNIGAY